MNFAVPYAANRTSVNLGTMDARDSSNTPRQWTGAATVDDYASGWVNKNPVTGILWFCVRTWPAKGQTKTVTVTITAKDAAGNDLVPITQALDLSGPPPDPLATHINPFTSPSIVNTFDPQAADPGSPTITLP